MEKHLYLFLIIFSIIISFTILSFISCIIAEFKKAKKEEIRLDNKVCYIPESKAFRFGIAALGFLVAAQIFGNLLICSNFCFRKNANSSSSKSKKPKILAIASLVFSWMSFGVAVIILSTSTSMSGKQEYGTGWLDQDCYIVKDGVFFGSGFLVLLCIAATLLTAFLTINNKPQSEQATRRIHAQDQ